MIQSNKPPVRLKRWVIEKIKANQYLCVDLCSFLMLDNLAHLHQLLDKNSEVLCLRIPIKIISLHLFISPENITEPIPAETSIQTNQ